MCYCSYDLNQAQGTYNTKTWAHSHAKERGGSISYTSCLPMPLDASQVKPISTKGKPQMKISPRQLYKELQFPQSLLFAYHPVVLNVVLVGLLLGVLLGELCSCLGKGKLTKLSTSLSTNVFQPVTGDGKICY